ncbi:40S ribosomal protein S12 [Operophtera brumata]|uniref:40S ribosomal protein S12 n=1 Tax=Operophtera brumata TaxID=104452 RepID=A0A0L7KZR7_OPEBR|nr:40S ribosomal protein S12 [Operophtera brumata]
MAEVEVEVPVNPVLSGGAMDVNQALQEVLKTALIHGGLVHGLHEAAKVDNNKKLGEWAGLCKIDKDGKARKIVGCSCVVIKDFGEETPALDVLKDYLKVSSS